MNLESIRHQYEQAGLDLADVDPHPIVQFRIWFDEWAATGPRDPGVVVVSTVDASGWPSSRAVLLRGVDERGFVGFAVVGRELRADEAVRDLRVLAFAQIAAEHLGEVRAVDLAHEDAPLVAQRGFQRVPGRPRGLAILAAPPPTTKCVFPTRREQAHVRLFEKTKFRSSFELYTREDLGRPEVLPGATTVNEYMVRRLDQVPTLRQVFYLVAPSRVAAERMSLFQQFQQPSMLY
mgnify:CR=1 FL=1